MQHDSRISTRHGDWTAVVFALFLPTLVTLAYFVWAEGSAAGAQQAIYGIAKIVQFAFPVVWVCWVRRQAPNIWPLSMRGVGVGFIFGLLVMAATVVFFHGWLKTTDLMIHASEEIRQKIVGLAIDQPWKYALLGVFYSLLHSLLEEYYWRWFVFGQLQTLVRFWPAVVISSLGFMAHHVIVLATFFGPMSPATWLLSFSVAIGGAVWAWIYGRSGSLLGPWISHMLVDAGIFLVGYNIVSDLTRV